MTVTRPDLSFPIRQLARFMSNPHKTHLKALERVWGYLQGTKNLALTKSDFTFDPVLRGYVDSDWGGDIGTRRSTTGYLFLVGNTAISWKSRLQKTVALSSCEAEYMALKDAIKEQFWLREMFKNISILNEIDSKDLYSDSQSAISLAKNPVYHDKTKHIDIQYHFVRESVLEERTNLLFIRSEQQLADGLTKAVSNEVWALFIRGLGLKELKL